MKCEDRYYIQQGPSPDSSLVEYYGHVHLVGAAKLLAPVFKPQWRDIKQGAREGLARLQGRPAEGELGAKQGAARDVQATPARGPVTSV